MNASTSTPSSSSKKLNLMLWVAQVVLALLFIKAGVMKLTQPVDQLSARLIWASQVPVALVRLIGLCEFLGGFGLILPAITRIKPMLTVYAAVGLLLIMVLATAFHMARGEFSAIAMTILLAVLALFIAWGRYKAAPFYTK